MQTNEIKLEGITSKEMQDLTIIVNLNYLLGLQATDRTILCKALSDKVKEFPLIKAPSCWEDAVRNPALYNAWAEEQFGMKL